MTAYSCLGSLLINLKPIEDSDKHHGPSQKTKSDIENKKFEKSFDDETLLNFNN